MTRYPLVESMGLKVRDWETQCDWVYAADLEVALAEAPVVSLCLNEQRAPKWETTLDTFLGRTHSARLLCVQPIAKDTAESLLREWIRLEDEHSNFGYDNHQKINALFGRARKLLGEGD